MRACIPVVLFLLLFFAARARPAPAKPYGWRPMAPPILRGFCSYEFPLEKIDPDSEVSLIIISPQGGEAELLFDLSRMR